MICTKGKIRRKKKVKKHHRSFFKSIISSHWNPKNHVPKKYSVKHEWPLLQYLSLQLYRLHACSHFKISSYQSAFLSCAQPGYPPLIPLLRLTLSSMKGACRSSVRGLRLILCMANWVAGYCQIVIGGRVVRPAVQRADLRGRGCNGRTYHPGRWIVCEVFVWLLLPPPRRLCVRTLFVGWFVGRLESRWRIF